MVYKDIHSSQKSLRPSVSARKELQALCHLSTLLHVKLSKQYSRVVVCTDASLYDGGVVSSIPKERESRRVSALNFEDQMTWIAGQQWSLAVKKRWDTKQLIHLLEGEAVLLGLQWVLRTSRYGTRVVFFVDNQSLIGTLRKWRSSKPSLNRIFRRVSALVCGGDLSVEYHYVKSESSPADKPSRMV